MKNIITLLVLVGMFKAGDAAITWTTPAGGSGTQSVPEKQNLNTEIVTFVATPNTGKTLGVYTLLTTGTPFAVSTGGKLTITSALDFETTSSYTLEIQVVDDTPASGTATISVTVTDVNEAPAFAKTTYATTIADGSPAGTNVFTAAATDHDNGDVITYTITDGDTGSHFAIDGKTGIITVNTGVTLNADTIAGYNLEITATDGGTPGLTDTTYLLIAVTSCSSATMIVFSTTMTLFASLLTVLQ